MGIYNLPRIGTSKWQSQDGTPSPKECSLRSVDCIFFSSSVLGPDVLHLLHVVLALCPGMLVIFVCDPVML